MKKLLSLCFAAILALSACDNAAQQTTTAEIAPDKVYFFFSNTCPHCHEALDYLNQKYPDLEVSMTNVGNPEGFDLFVKCARKFNLGNQIGTPLFCMGENYLMGWSPESEQQFDEYVKPFVK